MSGARGRWVWVDPAAALAISALAALMTVAAAEMETKYKLAAVLALAGFALLAVLPERKIACVVLWILIHPLSVEKVFFIDAAEGPQFTDPSIAINASDGPLALLILFLMIETMATGRSAFRWSRLTTILLLFLLWSAVSYAVHAVLLRDGFVTSSPLALIQDVRLLVFVLLIQSGIRTRADIAMALAAIGAAVLIQSGFVGLSYTTGSLFSYASAVNEPAAGGLMGFETSGGGAAVRGSGTVGQTNEQALFHTVMAIPLIALFGARNPLVRFASLGIVAASGLALVLTFSRGAWLAFPFGLGVAGLIALRRGLVGKTVVMTGAVLTVGATIAALFLAQPVYERLAYGDSGASESRLRMLGLAADLFVSDPIVGVGPGEFAEAALRLFPPTYGEPGWVAPGEALPFPAPSIGRVDIVQGILNGTILTRPLPVHNKYMLVLSELGLPGLALWLWFYAAFVAIAWRASKAPDLLLKLVGIGAVGAAASQLLYMMVDLFREDKPLEIMLFVPALAFAAMSCAGTERSQGLRPLEPHQRQAFENR